MTIRSNPPGALVYVDDYELGTTPISTDFTYYGIRKIRLVKDGYETLTVMQPVRAPWYQIPPLDFVTENFVPGELRDQRDFYYRLQPQVVVPTDRLLSRAEQLRRGVVPLGATGGGGTVRAGGTAPLVPGATSGALPPASAPGPLMPGPSSGTLPPAMPAQPLPPAMPAQPLPPAMPAQPLPPAMPAQPLPAS